MIIAREKRKTNIAEFVLYMWQIEDMIRAVNFNIDEIEHKIIRKYHESTEMKYEIRDWYNNLIQIMRLEKIDQKGHFSFVNNILSEVTDLHIRLLNSHDEPAYHLLYQQAAPNIEALRKRTDKPYVSEIEACLTGLYGYLLMRLQKKEISGETRDAMATFSNLLAALSKRFREIESGEKELP